MSPCAHDGTLAAASIKLGVNSQNRGTRSPSTSEGSPQGHQCQSSFLQANGAQFPDNGPNCMKEMQNVMGRYAMSMTKDGLLGEGSFSICRKGTDLTTGEAVAIKFYKVQQNSNENTSGAILDKFVKQVAVLKKLQEGFEQTEQSKLAKFFVRLLDYSRDASGLPGPDPSDGVLYVVTELAECSLKDYLRAQRAQGQALTSEAVRRLARSVVTMVAALHAKGYVHMDLKPENMMFFNGRLKIIDLDGCAKIGSKISLQDTSSAFSPCYCAPEWARFLQAGGQCEIVAEPSLDAWSVGLTLCECATLSPVMRPAFAHFLRNVNSAADAHMAYIDWLGSLETSPVPDCVEKFDARLGEFLSYGLLACDPDQRLTPAQCLSSQYLAAA